VRGTEPEWTDPENGALVRLFRPRQDRPDEHFERNGVLIVGSKCGWPTDGWLVEDERHRHKRPAVLEVSAQKLEALKRALARALGKRSQLRHPEFLILTRPQSIDLKITQDNSKIHMMLIAHFQNYLA